MSESRAADRVTAAVADIKRLIRDAPTEDVVGQCIKDNLAAANSEEPEHHLSSPAKQQAFLLTLLLATPPPLIRRRLTEADWERLYEQLQEAFMAYMEIFWPTAEEVGSLSAPWLRAREVALPAFLHYFNTGLLAHVEQVKNRIQRYVVPFDAVLEERWGLSASDALEVAIWVHDRLAHSTDELTTAWKDARAVQTRAEEIAADRGMPMEEAAAAAMDELSVRDLPERLQSGVHRLSALTPSEVNAAFPAAGPSYLDVFVAGRGTLSDITYPTEEYAWEAKAAVSCGEDRALIPSVNGLYTSVLVAAERELEGSSAREAYHRNRDRQLEREVVECFGRIFPNAQLLENVFETPDQHFEHDLVLLHEDAALIVEAKAAPPVAPFRDPERAFTRLRHAFRRDSGIQHGFEQAARIRRRLEGGEPVALYDSSGALVTHLDPEAIKHPICVCVTRDDFGYLATNLSLLLEKEDGEPFPWVLNVLDLDTIAGAWEHLSWGPSELLKYLRWRLRCHGKVMGSDELEFLGYHIRHGSLRAAVESDGDFMQLDPGYSDFFDELYYHQYLDGPAPDSEVVEPVVSDLRRSLEAGVPVFIPRTAPPGRNDECPCGSGKKYKKCCLRRQEGFS